MARISVMIPTSNSRDDLLATVDSVLKQTFQDFELIVADDGSTDDTGIELLRKLGPDPSRSESVWWNTLRPESGTRSIQMMRGGTLIHYLQTVTPRGMAATRNRAVAASCGELLAFARPGDTWFTWKLRTMLDSLTSRPELDACLEAAPGRSKARRAPAKGGALCPVDFREILECPNLTVSGAVLRRTCLDSDAPFDENLPVCEEYDFWLRVGSRHAISRCAEATESSAARARCADWGLERYRVYAMEKAYQGGQLDAALRYEVAKSLVRQCELLVAGYRGRDNQERANFYDRKRKRFAQEIAKLDLSDPNRTYSQVTV